MTTIQIDIDEVPMCVGNQKFILTSKEDPEGFGFVCFSIDVKIEPDGNWDITDVYPVTGIDSISLVYKRGKKMTGPISRDTVRFLETFAFNQIDDEVRNTIMQSDRKQFPKAVVV